jgi:Protein of unknown function (DUF1353)
LGRQAASESYFDEAALMFWQPDRHRFVPVHVSAWCLLAMLLNGRFLSAQQPIRPVPLTPFADGADSVLMADLRYQIGTTNFVIVVPLGFVTDFASTPKALWAVLPPFGTYQLAAVVHDFLYWDQGCTREQADALLRVAMAESKVDPKKRDIIWQAVRRFGQTAWDENARTKAAGQPRIIPVIDLDLPSLITWPEYRAQLVAKGVRPTPPPAVSPAYCTAAGAVNLVPN